MRKIHTFKYQQKVNKKKLKTALSRHKKLSLNKAWFTFRGNLGHVGTIESMDLNLEICLRIQGTCWQVHDIELEVRGKLNEDITVARIKGALPASKIIIIILITIILVLALCHFF